jgi:hypothetical protein
MQQTTPHSETPTNIPLRLQRLHELIARRADRHWGRSHIEETLTQDPQAPHTRCPGYAGILQESGEELVILAETPRQLADQMGALADAEIPIIPIELIDLDTGDRRLAYRQTTVKFLAGDAEVEEHMDNTREDALLSIHRYLYPEHYEDTPPSRWHAGTIEVVANMIKQAVLDHPYAEPNGRTRQVVGRIEVDVRKGLPSVTIIGAPDSLAVQVRGILRDRDKLFLKRITVTLPGNHPVSPDVIANAIEAAGEGDN